MIHGPTPPLTLRSGLLNYTDSDENNYAIWHFLKRCHERGLIYAGTDVMPWCPRCGTGLSQQEIQEGYREVTHPGVVLRLPLLDREGEFLLVWTTTPWTLTANVACTANPEVTYARVRQGDRVYYLAAARVAAVMTGEPYQVERELPGAELVGLRYRGPFDELPQERPALAHHRVLPWKEVSAEEGTGIVHIAPGCGEEDYALGSEHGLPAVAPIDEDGVFVEAAGEFAGLAASEAASRVIARLQERALLYRVDDYRHRYPHCWRCGTQTLFRLVEEWFIAMDPWRQEILRAAEQVEWIPSYGREIELDWLRNMRDWMISKKRYWGLALPIWRCACGWFDVIGGRDELQARAVAGWEEFAGHSPHRPWVDAVKIACPECGGQASRIPDVGNPWLDAGTVPFSTLRYFVARADWQRWFPAELVVESLPGQFRNWFYALLALSTRLEGRAPMRTVLGYATVLDARGEEMHKSKGNAIWFAEAAERMGADVVRWLSVSQPLTQPLRFGYARAEEVQAWLRTLWNVYSFLATYANVDGWPDRGVARPASPAAMAVAAGDLAIEESRSRGIGTTTAPRPLDGWLSARLAVASDAVAEAVESHDPPRAAGELLVLLDDLSNWWVRRSRRRFWRRGGGEEKEAAYRTLHDALLIFCQLLAPFVPFTAEALYQRLRAPFATRLPESVHLCMFPVLSVREEGRALLAECELAREVVRLGRAARERVGLRVRQPLREVRVWVGDGRRLPHFEQDVLDELNVKQVRFVTEREEMMGAAAEGDGIAVALEATLSDELLREGAARDLMRHLQNLRKRVGLRVDQHLHLWVKPEPARTVAAALTAYRDLIAAEVLADTVEFGPAPDGAARVTVTVGAEQVTLAILAT